MGQEIKNRSKPDKTGQIRSNPGKSGNPSKDIDLGNFMKLGQFFALNLAEKAKKFYFSNQNWDKKSSQKIFHFLKDFHSLTPAAVLFPLEQSLILLGRIHASGHLSNNKELVHFHSQSTMKY